MYQRISLWRNIVRCGALLQLHILRVQCVKTTMKNKNTLQKGSVRIIVFRDGDIWYGAGLEFNIVESGSTPQEAMFLLIEALQGYVESAKKIKARPYILNQKTDLEYEGRWRRTIENRLTQNRQNVFFAGRMNTGSPRVLVSA